MKKNKKKDFSKTIARAQADGIRVPPKVTRTLGIMERMYEEIDKREAMRKGCVINVKAICDTLGISRPNVESNPYLKAVIEAHRAVLPDVSLCRRLAKLEAEIAAQKKRNDETVTKDLEKMGIRLKKSDDSKCESENTADDNNVNNEPETNNVWKAKYELAREELEKERAKNKELEDIISTLSKQVSDEFLSNLKNNKE